VERRRTVTERVGRRLVLRTVTAPTAQPLPADFVEPVVSTRTVLVPTSVLVPTTVRAATTVTVTTTVVVPATAEPTGPPPP
jgi:hypothetical protein